VQQEKLRKKQHEKLFLEATFSGFFFGQVRENSGKSIAIEFPKSFQLLHLRAAPPQILRFFGTVLGIFGVAIVRALDLMHHQRKRVGHKAR